MKQTQAQIAKALKPKAVMLGVSLRPDRIQWVRQTADQKGISISQVVRDLIDENALELVGLLDHFLPGTRYDPPRSTYLAWIDCSALGLGDDPAATFRARGVELSPGPQFGPPGTGHVRLNMATSPAILAAMLLPALSKAKLRSHGILCMNNGKHKLPGYVLRFDGDTIGLVDFAADLRALVARQSLPGYVLGIERMPGEKTELLTFRPVPPTARG